MEITLKMSLDNLNSLLSALGNLPFAQVAPIIHDLHQQAIPQIQAQQPVEEKKEEVPA